MAEERRQQEMAWEAGHFYSPIPSLEDVRVRQEQIFQVPRYIPGVDLNELGQIQRLQTLTPLFRDQPFPATQSPGTRYYFENRAFQYGSGLTYQAILRHEKPKRVVEVGSGFTTALLLDVVDRFLPDGLACSCVEPYPDTLRMALRREDFRRIDLIAKPVQEVPIHVFESLEPGDILFIDSTHVCKTGSDVNRLIFEVLPSLATGVMIHFHDIYYPFEYPKEWVFKGIAWNEAYLVRGFLQYNKAFRIDVFNSFATQFLTEHIDRSILNVDLYLMDPGSSLWIRKL